MPLTQCTSTAFTALTALTVSLQLPARYTLPSLPDLCNCVRAAGEYSARTDGYAVGVTLLVCLTGRGAEGIFDACETDLDTDFEEIDAIALAQPAVGWPPQVARALVALVLCRDSCGASLCTPKKRKRIELEAAVFQLSALLSTPAGGGDGGDGGGADAVAGADSSAVDVGEAGDEPTTSQLQPSDASRLVRKLGRAAASSDEGAERVRRLQQKASEGFRHMMGRVANVYASRASEAPDDFRERLDFYRQSCGLPPPLHERLHRLRMWRNASEHGDEEELVELLRACDALAERLEK